MNLTQTIPENSIMVLDHNLNQYFPELLKFNSTTETEKSAVFQKIKPTVERILNAVVCEDFAENAAAYRQSPTEISTIAWNIERGCVFEGILEALKTHPELKGKDLYLLTELDYGMAGSGNHFIAQELARELKLNYAFAPVYIALQNGSGVEAKIEGENTKSIHGLAMLSKYPLKNVHTVDLPNGKDKMKGIEKRLGYLRALIADIEHPLGIFRAVTLHLDAHCSRKHRKKQLQIVLDHLDALPNLPTIIGGDWNTSTFDSQHQNFVIFEFWRKVFITGIRNSAHNHFPYPDRYFERPLFKMLEGRGWEYKSLNENGVGTLHYDLDSIEKTISLRDWMPKWTFRYLFWAMRKIGDKLSVRLDWFTGKGIKIIGNPKTIGNLKNAQGTPLSDHDAIGLGFKSS